MTAVREWMDSMKNVLELFGAHVMIALAMATSMCQADSCSFSKDAFANEIEAGELPGVIRRPGRGK